MYLNAAFALACVHDSWPGTRSPRACGVLISINDDRIVCASVRVYVWFVCARAECAQTQDDDMMMMNKCALARGEFGVRTRERTAHHVRQVG